MKEQKTRQLDLSDTLKEYVEVKDGYDRANHLAKELKAKVEQYKTHIIEVMDEKQMSSVKIEGLGRFTVKLSEKWAYPKDLEERKKFNKWIVLNASPDYLLSRLTMTASHTKTIVEEHKERLGLKEAEKVDVPGLDDPYVAKTLSVTKDKV